MVRVTRSRTGQVLQGVAQASSILSTTMKAGRSSHTRR
jgi:hypothetical protein